jgi:CRISPR-associated protein Cmr1
MRRPNPAIDPDTAFTAWKEDAEQRKPDWTPYDCKLVTPLYGGGVRPGEVDEAMPIRPSGIRGQLRFWWRLACGPFASPAEMFRREAAIWGGIGGSGPTASRVSVNHTKPGELRTMPDPADWIEPYAVFPARGELSQDKRSVEKAPHRLAHAGLGFRLGVHLHGDLDEQQRQEMQTALRWWASFGGVGARTRRGLGAVQIRDLQPVSREEVEGRGGQLCLRDVEKGPEEAWKKAVGRLSSFRQGEGSGRNPRKTGSNTPGRSCWPEPDMIRRQTGRHAPEHKPEHPVRDVYPRAAFGLPIVFHFKDENKGEPAQQLLVPEDGDRMASQLILRPYWDGQRWSPAALLIPGWEQALAVIAQCGEGADHRAWPRNADEQAQRAKEIKPMAKHGDDPLSAFMTYFQED